ncbi:VOC family protein [Gluconobacter cerinus]|uniref:hypothetical protein n=1 Tax=Gluconobacter cerinus TaxID=38307 RepID=UPI001B8C5AED|nr:hypothetical protein [Gluconobacter cerinus]MBS1026552.1 hypothetical protein [Gluconobacter cerinus]MBS1045731.1 hypothetical protein [Gluconobacter cerinus]
MGELPTSSPGFAVEHVVLTVNNLEKVTTFYQVVIGLDRTPTGQTCAATLLSGSSAIPHGFPITVPLRPGLLD